MKKLSIARGVISKLKHYASNSILRNVYYAIVYSQLMYGITSWGNSAAKFTNKVQIQQNYIIKIITKVPFFKTKLLPLYRELKILKIHNIYKLEVLKIMFKIKEKLLPNCFCDFFHSPSDTQLYPTRHATSVNFSVMRCSKSFTQRSIRCEGPKLWNALPIDIKTNSKSIYSFSNRVKELIHQNQF